MARLRSPNGTALPHQTLDRIDAARCTRCHSRVDGSKSMARQRPSGRSGCRRSAGAAYRTHQPSASGASQSRVEPAQNRDHRRDDDRRFRPEYHDRYPQGPRPGGREQASRHWPARRAKTGRAIRPPHDTGRIGRCRHPSGSRRPDVRRPPAAIHRLVNSAANAGRSAATRSSSAGIVFVMRRVSSMSARISGVSTRKPNPLRSSLW